MAISRVFRFRTPLSGNRDFCHVMCCGPSAYSFPLGPRSWGGSGGMPWVRIPTATGAFPNVGVGEASFTTQRYRRGVLMRGGTGHDGFAENQGTRPRTFLGTQLSRGRGIRPNVAVSANDERAIEVLASGLPLHHGAQLAVDITVRSATTSTGLPATNAAHTNGADLMAARRAKEQKFRESCWRARDAVWWWWASKLGVGGAPKPSNFST